MTWIGISGLHHPDDVALCAALGVDALGFVVGFPHRGPWNLTLDEAEELVLGVPGTVQRVAVVGEDPDTVLATTRRLQPRIVQLHADEPPGVTLRLVGLLHAHDVRVMKTLRLRRDDGTPVGRHVHDADPLAAARRLVGTGIDLLMVDLVDAPGPAGSPGSGGSAALSAARRIREGIELPVVLAGGLRPDTVRTALEAVDPDGVDVISGVEGAGHRTDPAKVAALVVAVRGQGAMTPGHDRRSAGDA